MRKYTIRTPIDETLLDTPVTLTNNSGSFRIKREFTFRTILVLMIACILYFYITMHTFMEHAGLFPNIFFALGYFMLAIATVVPTQTQVSGWHLISPTINYILGINRQVETRSVAPANAVKNLIGIQGFTTDNHKLKNNQLMVFNNGDVGEIMDVNGNASILTFDADRRAIINATDSFYRQVKPNVSLTIDSVSTSQRVKDQLEAKDIQLQYMKYNTNNLKNLLNYQRNILKNFVGKQFKAWHQYIIVRAKSRTALRAFNEWLLNCYQHDRLFVSSYRKLPIPEALHYLKDLYGDDVSNVNK